MKRSVSLGVACLASVLVLPNASADRPGYWEKDQAKMKGWVQSFGCDIPMRLWPNIKTKSDVYDKLSQIENAVGECRSFVGWATEDGLDPETEVVCFEKKLKFKEVRESVCEGFFHYCAGLYPKLAEGEQECKAIRDVLSGDKLRWFTGEAQKASNPGCHGLGYFQGRSGKLLKAPEEFKKEPVWFKFTVDRSGLQPRWDLLRIPFNGMKEAGRQTTQSGFGTEPPSSAFK